MLSRFKVTKRGKLKRHHAKTSHLMSGRSSKTKRRLGRPAILHEGLARNLRVYMGISRKNPAKIEHEMAAADARKKNPKAESKTA
jgi:large subunit ribosomal protein L35